MRVVVRDGDSKRANGIMNLGTLFFLFIWYPRAFPGKHLGAPIAAYFDSNNIHSCYYRLDHKKSTMGGHDFHQPKQASAEEMAGAKIDIAFRDSCAALLIPLNT
jgi:hypothetical protein